ncbi:MAG: hypothetical protein OJF49_001266 [Ktedonobacterales bacterium]|nr:MAG: hypothetical protein OJF49_001266 [Ktedonobacterales bacterium]
MMGTVALLLLIAWFVCTVVMTIRSSRGTTKRKRATPIQSADPGATHPIQPIRPQDAV